MLYLSWGHMPFHRTWNKAILKLKCPAHYLLESCRFTIHRGPESCWTYYNLSKYQPLILESSISSNQLFCSQIQLNLVQNRKSNGYEGQVLQLSEFLIFSGRLRIYDMKVCKWHFNFCFYFHIFPNDEISLNQVENISCSL